MCCGQKRSAVSPDGTPHPTAVKLLYCGDSPANIRGYITGQLYQFSQLFAIQPVDPRDASLMMQTRLFRRIQ